MVDVSKFIADGDLNNVPEAEGLANIEEGVHTLDFEGSEDISGENEKTGPAGWQGVRINFVVNGTKFKLNTGFIMSYGDEGINHVVAKRGLHDFKEMCMAFGLAEGEAITEIDTKLFSKSVKCNVATNDAGYLNIDTNFGKNWEAAEAVPEVKVPLSNGADKSEGLTDDKIPF